MALIKRLFSNLYYRFNKENDLSDITWVVCQVSSSFQQLFLNFFFPEVIFSQINSFNREQAKEESRADFVINNNGEIFVIECKIYDKNHHFEQYINTYNIEKEHLGYIVNYNLSKNGFNIKTWQELYDYIEENLPSDNDEEKELYESYLEYLKHVCGIIKITEKMELKGIYSLYSFNIILKSVINRTEDNFALSYYNNDFKDSYYGYKFKVESQNKKDIWLNVGLWFKYENPIITIGVWKQEGWGKPFCDEIESGKKYNGKYTKKHYWEDSTYYFEGSERFYDEFENANNANTQKQILCAFVDEVIKFYINP